jgi:hypothetical protein
LEFLVEESQAAAELEAADEGFAEAMEAYPDRVHESFYLFAGRTVRMRMVGHRLAADLPGPFSHLRIDRPDSAAVRLFLDVWDEQETGIVRGPGLVPVTERVTSFSRSGRFVRHATPHISVSLDRRTCRMVGSLAWADSADAYQRGKPFARLLLEWYNDRNVQVVHAGLVAEGEQGLLLGGKSGSGKSTAALACVRSGLNFLGEDYVGLQRAGGGTFVGHSLYNSVFLGPEALAWFPELTRHVLADGQADKSAVILATTFPGRLRRSVSVRALAICSPAEGAESRMEPVSRGEALLALASSSLLEIPSRGKSGFATLTELVERMPCWSLELGTDLGTLPRCVSQILARSNGSD